MQKAKPMYALPFRNIRDILGLHAKVASRKVALISDQVQQPVRKISYLELVGRTHQVANVLYEDLGIERGDCIALVNDHHENALILALATWIVGATLLVIDHDPQIASGDIHRRLQKNQATILFVPADKCAHYQHLHEAIIQMGGEAHSEYLRFEDLAANRPTTFLGDASGAKGADVPLAQANAQTAGLSDVALKQYRAGRLVTHTQHDLIRAANQSAQLTAFTGNQVLLVSDDLFAYIAQSVLTALLVGGTALLNQTFSPDRFWESLVRERAHTALLNAQQLAALIKTARGHIAAGQTRYGSRIIQQDVKHVRHMLVLDTHVTPDLMRDFQALFGLHLITACLMPQSAHLLTLLPLDLAWRDHQKLLQGYSHVTLGASAHEGALAVHDDNGLPCSPEQAGHFVYQQIDGEWVDTGMYVTYRADDTGRHYYFLAQ